MRTPFFQTLTAACGILAVSLATALHAGAPDFKSGKEVQLREPEEVFGSISIGARFSDHLTDGYVDLLQPLCTSPNHVFALNVRSVHNDSDQDRHSFGGVFRYLVPDSDLIIGVNAYYDYLESQNGNHFDQLGLGAEILSRWVDARFNYYLPDDSSYVVGSKTVRRTRTFSETTREISVTTSQRFRQLEVGLEGFYAEAGFLVPKLDEYFELRLLGGYFKYNNPFGRNFEGFQARAEARLTQGLIADVAWFDDARIQGGHWVAGVRVEVPFDLGNLFRGRNPFEGAGDTFRFGRRDFRARMREMVQRSPRTMTASSNSQPTGSPGTSTNTQTFAPVPAPTQAPTQPPR